jgi:hypothetical protein
MFILYNYIKRLPSKQAQESFQGQPPVPQNKQTKNYPPFLLLAALLNVPST